MLGTSFSSEADADALILHDGLEEFGRVSNPSRDCTCNHRDRCSLQVGRFPIAAVGEGEVIHDISIYELKSSCIPTLHATSNTPYPPHFLIETTYFLSSTLKYSQKLVFINELLLFQDKI